MVWAFRNQPVSQGNLETLHLAPLVFGSTGNICLPHPLFGFGEAGLDCAVIVFAIMAIWPLTFGV